MVCRASMGAPSANSRNRPLCLQQAKSGIAGRSPSLPTTVQHPYQRKPEADCRGLAQLREVRKMVEIKAVAKLEPARQNVQSGRRLLYPVPSGTARRAYFV